MSNLEQKLQTVEETLERAAYGPQQVSSAYLTLAVSQLLEVLRELSAEGKVQHGQR